MWAIGVIGWGVGRKSGAEICLGAFVLEKLLLRENLKQDPILKTLIVIRQPNATNYKITQQDCQRVHE